jgi:hypothetical protein
MSVPRHRGNSRPAVAGFSNDIGYIRNKVPCGNRNYRNSCNVPGSAIAYIPFFPSTLPDRVYISAIAIRLKDNLKILIGD